LNERRHSLPINLGKPTPIGVSVKLAVVQPGGSIRDEEVIEAARAAEATVYVTGTRYLFR
jgi:AICAR transformylase/IMP cyclohydrolase PurH